MFSIHFPTNRVRAYLMLSLFAALLAVQAARAETLTLAPGATVWDGPTANWRNSGGSLVPYLNGVATTPVINGPVTVLMTEPRVSGSMILNNGVTVGSSTNNYLLFAYGSTIQGNGGAPNIFNTRVFMFEGGTLELGLRGYLTFNQNLEAGAGHPVVVSSPGNAARVTLGPGAALLAPALTLGTAAENNLVFFNTGAGSVVATTGNLVVGQTKGNPFLQNSIVEATQSNFSIGGDLILAHDGNCNVTVNGGTVSLGGALRIADIATGTPLPNGVLMLRNTTLTVADSGGPGIRGEYFSTGGDIGVLPTIQMPGTRLEVRPGGFLTVADRIGFGVNNTIVDTTGGGAVIHGRLWGKALIKEGPGILKLTRDNRNGGGGQGVLDGTIVRGGFIEFAESINLNDGGGLNYAANQNQAPTGLKNIQLDGGGLRWAAGTATDISSRLRLLNNFSFDTNGNNVAFATSLAGTGGMTKVGAGTLTPAGTNTYAGGTTVKGGAVQFASLATFGSGNVTLDGGGLRWSTNNPVDVSPRMAPLGVGGGILDTNGNNVSFNSGSLSGPGALTKIGAGVLSIQGTHPWTGGLHINGGSMTLNGAFPGKAQLVVGDTGTGALTLTGTLGTTGQTSIGNAPGIAGTVDVGNFGNLNTGTFLEVGTSGSGTLNVSNGGQVTSATTTALAVYPGSFGQVNVSGLGGAVGTLPARLSAGASLFVGYQGPAVCTVGSGGVVTVGGQLSCGELPGGSGAFVLAQGGTLNVGGADGIRTGTGEPGFYLSGGTLKVTGSTLTSTLPMVCTNNTLIDTSGVNCVLDGALSGAGGFTKIGGGILYLNVPNSYAGGSTLYGGQIVVPAANSLGTGAISVLGGSLYSSGIFSRDVPIIVDGAGTSLGAASYIEIGAGDAGSLAVTNGAQVSTPSSIAFAVLPGGTSGSASVTGAGSSLACGTTMYLGYQGSGFLNVASGGSVGVGGQLLLGTTNTGAGTFTLNPGGTLNVGGTNGIAKGSGTAGFYLSGGTLKITGSDLTSALPMMLSQFSLIDTSGVTCTLSGPLSGTGGIAKNGGGTLTLSGANTYTGTTAVFAGTLVVGSPTLADTADVALSSGTVLHLPFTGADTVRRFTIDGLVQSTGTWGSLASTATHKTALITGPGILAVSSNGAADFTIIPPANNSATVGQPYSGTFTQSGAFGSVTWSYDPAIPGNSPPPGLTFSSTGVLSGTPTSAGSFGFTVKVTDVNGFFATHIGNFTFTHPVITVQNPGIASGRKNVAFSQTFTSSGGNGASTFTLSSGTLPGGLTLAGNGTLSGTPSVAGNFPITVTATDIYGGTASSAGYALSIAATSANANLAALGVSSGILTPAFASITTAYQINVGPDTALLYVVPTGADPLATITVNGSFTTNGGDSPGIPLATGANVIPIVVTSSDFTTQKTYTLTATRTGGLVLTGGGLTLLEEGGTFRPGNVAPAGTAFAKDVLPGHDAHSIPHLNDAAFGNASSWIANSQNSFAGISLGAATVRVNEFAFGRDNAGIFPDRCLTRYTLQFTTAPNPTAATPDASWSTIGTLDYFSAGGANFAEPARRHRYSFTPVMATGLRLVAVASNTAMDEIEIYPQVGLVLNGGGLALEAEGGTFAPDNLARTATATPFADGVLIGFPQHTIPHLNDGQYGNDFSWLNDIPAPFAGVALGASRIVNRIAFGRDNTGVFTNDRTLGLFTLQYTNVPNPSASTPAGSWTTIGTLDYQFAGGHNFATPARRHLFSFTPVTATALRLVGSTGNNCIDELEIYRWLPRLGVEHPPGTPITSNTGTVNFGSVLPGGTNTKTFTLTNSGPTPLNLGALSLTGTHSAHFSTTPPASSTLAQGESTTFTATFAPGTEGVFSALLHIPSNDPDFPDFLIPLIGTCASPPPVISGYGNLTNSAQDELGVVHFYPAATATDESGIAPTVTYSHASGSLFPIGITTVIITAADDFNNTSTASFSITIAATSNPPPVPIGGTVPLNLASGKTAFARDHVGVAPHAIADVNDGLYGDANSWIAGTLDSFVGINLGATPLSINRVAFGRDHAGVQTSRSDGAYTLQYTTIPNPDATTPDASWQTIAGFTYPGSVVNPALRHMYAFPLVAATGFRLKTLAPVFGIGIDELELYGPLTALEAWRLQHFGTNANTGTAANGADFNHNGISNLLEYALNGDPVGQTTGLAILPQSSVVSGQLQLTFQRHLDRTDLTLTVQGSDNLTTWSDLAQSLNGTAFTALFPGPLVSETGTGNVRSITFTDPYISLNARFIRLRATSP